MSTNPQLSIETSPRLLAQSQSPREEWTGASPNRFRINQRKHFTSSDILGLITQNKTSLERKHYEPKLSLEMSPRSGIKNFPTKANRESSVSDHQTIFIRPEFMPSPKAYGHNEKKHLSQDGSEEFVFKSHIKTFHGNALTLSEIDLRNLFGKKKYVDSVEDQRNMMPLKSLGDKNYKTVEYCPKFFNDGGLAVGSSNSTQAQKTIQKLFEPFSPKQKGISYKDRQILHEKAEGVNAVRDLNNWEKTTLKQFNPNHKDVQPTDRTNTTARRTTEKKHFPKIQNGKMKKLS